MNAWHFTIAQAWKCGVTDPRITRISLPQLVRELEALEVASQLASIYTMRPDDGR